MPTLFGLYCAGAVAAPAPLVERAENLLRRLEWTVLRRLDGLLQGHHRTVMRGQGMDLADLREYQHHDDVRHIDWNLTARMDQPHVRVFTEDREMSAWFLLDLSGSVDFGSGHQRKSDLAQELVAVLARMLTREGNRVGAMIYRSQVEAVLPARGGRPQVLQLMHLLRQRPAQVSSAPTRLHDLLRTAAQGIRRRSTIVLVSDFISEPGWEQALGLLAQRHDVVAVRLYDPLEMDLPDIGLLPLRDAETGQTLWVDTHDKAKTGKKTYEPVAPGSNGSTAIILLTDGQRTTGVDPMEAAKLAADYGVRVYTVGVGTVNGETIGFEGWSMRVRLDEESLKAIAAKTQAEYFYAGTAQDLKKVYTSLSSKLTMQKKDTEISGLLALVGAALALLSAGLSMLWFNRIA